MVKCQDCGRVDETLDLIDAAHSKTWTVIRNEPGRKVLDGDMDVSNFFIACPECMAKRDEKLQDYLDAANNEENEQFADLLRRFP